MIANSRPALTQTSIVSYAFPPASRPWTEPLLIRLKSTKWAMHIGSYHFSCPSIRSNHQNTKNPQYFDLKIGKKKTAEVIFKKSLLFFRIFFREFFSLIFTVKSRKCRGETKINVYRRRLLISLIYRVENWTIKFSLFHPTSQPQTAPSPGPF